MHNERQEDAGGTGWTNDHVIQGDAGFTLSESNIKAVKLQGAFESKAAFDPGIWFVPPSD